MAEMPECPECGGYNVVVYEEFDDRDGELVYTSYECRDCRYEWVDDSDEPDEDEEA